MLNTANFNTGFPASVKPGITLAQQIILAQRKKLHGLGIDEKLANNKKLQQSRKETLFYGSIYDENPEVWKIIFPGINPAVIVQEKIPKFLKSLYKQYSSGVGVTMGYPKNRNAYDNEPGQLLGWHDHTPHLTPVYYPSVDGRSLWQRFTRQAPIILQGEFMHFYIMLASNILTPKGKQVLDSYSDMKGWSTFEESAERQIEAMFPSRGVSE